MEMNSIFLIYFDCGQHFSLYTARGMWSSGAGLVKVNPSASWLEVMAQSFFSYPEKYVLMIFAAFWALPAAVMPRSMMARNIDFISNFIVRQPGTDFPYKMVNYF